MATATLQFKDTNEGQSTPQKNSKEFLYVLVQGLDDGYGGLGEARAQAIIDFTVPNMSGQLLYPFSTWLIAPELTNTRARWIRGNADAAGAMVIVEMEFSFLDSLTTFGDAAYANTRQVSQFFFALKPWDDYTNPDGGDGTTDVNTIPIGDGTSATRPRQEPKSFSEQEIIVKVRTSLSQASWAQPLQGGILDSDITLMGATYPTGTVLFEGVEQNYIESQENVVGFKFTIRPIWAWLQDVWKTPNVNGDNGAESVRRFQKVTWTAPSV